MCHFWAQNGSFAPNKNFFWKKILISFSSTYWALSFCKIFKKFLGSIKSYDVPFLAPKGPFVMNKISLVQTIIITFIYLLTLFIVQNFKKNSYSGSWVMRMHNFWAQNSPFPQMRIFSENLLMSLVSFIHAYLHVKNQSRIFIY